MSQRNKIFWDLDTHTGNKLFVGIGQFVEFIDDKKNIEYVK